MRATVQCCFSNSFAGSHLLTYMYMYSNMQRSPYFRPFFIFDTVSATRQRPDPLTRRIDGTPATDELLHRLFVLCCVPLLCFAKQSLLVEPAEAGEPFC